MTLLKNIFFLLFLFTGTLSSCQPAEKSSQNHDKEAYQKQNEDDFAKNSRKKHKKHRKRDRDRAENSKYTSENRADDTQTDIRTGNVPKALKVLKYVRENGVAIDGYVGGRRFGNYENLLPKKDKSGKRIDYQEWDVNPKIRGKNRGTERLITGSDGKAYYTNDHYRSFVVVE